MLRSALACLAVMGCATSSLAEEAYLDDHSNPAALVRSLYNAINRGEYARAFSYFAEPPAADLESYAAGFADTRHVRLKTGQVFEEGAMGSAYFELPVAIEATKADGTRQTFAGCYFLKRGGVISEETFSPLIIERGKLRPSKLPLDRAVPADCDEWT